MKTLAIIPARGGSKGIKNKNLKKINNKPLIKYTLDSVKKCKLIDDIIVSTDSVQIKKYCEAFDIEVPFLRPKYLSTDKALTVDVALHGLKKYSQLTNKKFDYVIILQPTTPFRTNKFIDQSISLAINNDVDALTSLTDVGANHPYRMYTLGKNSLIKPILQNESTMVARQLLPKFYIRSGEIYLIKSKILKKHKTLLPPKTIGLVNNYSPNVNIDTINDIYMAEIISKNEKNFNH